MSIEHFIGSHKMTVLLDSGVNRHLRFSDDGGKKTNHWFDLITFDEGLLINSGFGSYSFSKRYVADMFEFFRWRESDSDYVLEKVASKSHDIMAFCEDFAKQYIIDGFECWLDVGDFCDDEKKKMYDEFLDALNEDKFESAQDAIREYQDFTFRGNLIRIDFDDFYPYKPSARYIDCVEAIKWGIGEYDKSKSAA